MEPIDHPVSQYALSVIEGDTIAGPLVRMACERHLLDLETGRDRGLYFDCKAADSIVRFASILRHTTGDHAGAAFKFRPWQIFRHGSVFGWKREGGLRRFRSTYHQVAKKNGKTTDTVPPMLYTLLFDGESAPQGYCAATTRDQAGHLFKELRRMIRASPELSSLLRNNKYEITCDRTQGMIRPLSRDGNSADGINPHFAALDEVHRWTDRELAEVVVNSMIARSQPIEWAITTAGANRGTLCGEMRTHAENVLRGDVKDDNFFAYVSEPPEDSDPADPVTWHMANPNLNVSVLETDFRKIYEKALAIPGQMPNFRRLHLNLWTAGEQSWIARDTWDKGAAAAPFDAAKLFGRKAWVGIDKSRTTDMTAIAVAVPVESLIYLIVYSFLPEGDKGFVARAQTENRDYVGWRDDGWLEVHPGAAISDTRLLSRLRWIRDRFDLQEVAYDRWGMDNMVRELTAERFPMLEHGQGFKGMSNPVKRFEKAVLENRIRHGGNPCLAWAVGNVRLDIDKAENLSPNKMKAKGRIDPAVAAIMAVGRAEYREEKRRAREINFV